MLNVLIVDDEKKARETLRLMLERFCKDVQIVAELSSGQELIEKGVDKSIDVIFLDINFGKYTGFDILKELDRGDAKIIFVTAFDQFGIEAVKNQALDYIMKPVDPEELMHAIDKLRSEVRHPQEIPEQTKETLLLPINNTYTRIRFDDIVHVEADGAYVTIYCRTEKFYCAKSIGALEELLPKDGFMRVHHSHIVGLEHVKAVKIGRDEPIVLKSEKEVPLARNKRKELLSKL